MGGLLLYPKAGYLVYKIRPIFRLCTLMLRISDAYLKCIAGK